MAEDIRWKQRFANFQLALETLDRGVVLAAVRPLSELEQQGLIQGFEFTHELGWKLLKDYLEEQGFVGLIGSRDASREAFQNGLISDGDAWMDMIKARNLSSDTYNAGIADEVAREILARFHPAFVALAERMGQLVLPESKTK